MIIANNFRTPDGKNLIAAAQQAAAAIPKIASPVPGDLVSQAADGTLSKAGVAPTAFARAPADVATNGAKLALTGISAGHIVRITGEANRLEMYTGGAINNDANWQIIGRNTYKMTIHYRGGGTTIHGVVFTGPDETKSIGWVMEGQVIQITDAMGPMLGLGLMAIGNRRMRNDLGEIDTYTDPQPMWSMAEHDFLAPAGVPPRGFVSVLYIQDEP